MYSFERIGGIVEVATRGQR